MPGELNLSSAGRYLRQGEPQPPPRCPYCGDDPLVLNARDIRMNDRIATVISCANLRCRKALAIQVLGQLATEENGATKQ